MERDVKRTLKWSAIISTVATLVTLYIAVWIQNWMMTHRAVSEKFWATMHEKEEMMCQLLADHNLEHPACGRRSDPQS